MMDFKLARYEFDLILDEDVSLPMYAGSTLRGGFGRAFRGVVCASNRRECVECLLRENCIFPRVFDTAPPEGWGMMPNQTDAPRPFVIEPPINGKQVYNSGEVIAFGLILVGYVVDYLPYFIYSFEELGRKFGLGRGRGKFRLVEVRSVSMNDNCTIYMHNDRLMKDHVHIIDIDSISKSLDDLSSHSMILDFVTPTKITHSGNMLSGDDVQFEKLMRAIFRRASMLAELFCNSKWELDYSSLLEKAKEIRANSIGHEVQRWERYSTRQGGRIPMSGFTGEVSIDGNLKEFLPFIKLGELIHVGKGTTFGLGKYVIKRGDIS